MEGSTTVTKFFALWPLNFLSDGVKEAGPGGVPGRKVLKLKN
jgi:hypothetical protein